MKIEKATILNILNNRSTLTHSVGQIVISEKDFNSTAEMILEQIDKPTSTDSGVITDEMIQKSAEKLYTEQDMVDFANYCYDEWTGNIPDFIMLEKYKYKNNKR